MAGLSLTLPAILGNYNQALVTLTVPNPYATGSNFPGGMFGISLDGTVLAPFAAFTYIQQAPPSFGRVPTTLAVMVQLTGMTQAVSAQWASIRNSNVIIDSPASLSAVIA